MAYTASSIAGVNTTWGNKLVKVLNVTADAASGSVSTGLNVVDFAMVQLISAATGAFKVKVNLTVASAAANGTVFVSSAASGDNFVLIAVGH